MAAAAELDACGQAAMALLQPLVRQQFASLVEGDIDDIGLIDGDAEEGADCGLMIGSKDTMSMDKLSASIMRDPER